MTEQTPRPQVHQTPAPSTQASTAEKAPYPPTANALDSDSRMWAMWAHLSSFSGWVTAIGYIVGPLIVWQIKKDQHPFVDFNGKEALNFNLSLALYSVISFGLALTIIGLVIAIPALLAIVVGQIVFTVIAAVKANQGEAFRYPLAIRFVK